jgi:hypothetical protein
MEGNSMALPTSIETGRTLYLQNILLGLSSNALGDWPMPIRSDFVLIGRIIVQYSYIDFYLHRMIEIYEKYDLLPSKWRGKTAKMPIGDIETIIQAAPDWAPSNVIAFQRIKEFRKVRNLMAHFAIKRFPNDDAFLFITKSANDFKRVLGFEPKPGMAMTGVADIAQTAKISKVIEGLLKWLSVATVQLEDPYFKNLKRS